MILSKEMLRRVLEISKSNRIFKKQFRFSFAPDETYFATLIHYFGLSENLKINNLPTHLVVFEVNAGNPIYLGIADIEKKNIENTLFARKFDYAVNNEAIAYVNILRG